jgi:hypothetical protein
MNLFKSFDISLGQYICARPLAAGGASGSTTMVVMFIVCLCCCGWTHDITSSMYVKNGTQITLR